MRQIIIYRGDDGWWVTECPSLPGCISQGKTEDEAIANIKEAIRGYLAALEEDGIAVESVEMNEKRETEYGRYVSRKIEAGLKDVAEGRTFSNEELRDRYKLPVKD